MLGLLSFMPLVGNIINGITTYLNKKQDTDLEKYKVKGTVDVEAMRTDAEILKARVDLAKTRSGDKGDAVGRYLIIWPTGLYVSCVYFDSIFRNTAIGDYTWRVLELPLWMQYIPYAVVAYLLAIVIKNSLVR